MNLVLRALKEIPIEYANYYLSQGRGICLEILTRLNGARCSALVPDGTSDDRISAFSDGGLTDMEQSAGWLKRHVIKYVEDSNPGAFMEEDMWLTPDVLGESPRGVTTALIRDEVYYLPIGGVDSRALDNMFRAVQSKSFVGYLLNCRQIDIEKILRVSAKSAAMLVDTVIIGAYDQESFLLIDRLQ